jgi:predicted nucleic acid-binding protein
VPFSALLDANVLVPNVLRDTLLLVAESGLYRPLSSEDILAEVRRTVLRLRPDIRPDRLDYTFSRMNEAFEGACVTGYQSIIPHMSNDDGDRHVLAAAVVGRADLIVTRNLSDFPVSSLVPFQLEAQDPDQFLCHQYDLQPSLVAEIIRRQSAMTGRAPGHRRRTVPEVLFRLSKCGAATFADRISAHLDLSTGSDLGSQWPL